LRVRAAEGIVTTGEQTRLTRQEEGRQQRLGIQEQTKGTVTIRRAEGEEQRAGIRTTGGETRSTRRVEGEEQRAGIKVTGGEQRATVRTTGEETRATELQREQFRRYKENRDYEQAQRQARA